MSSGSDSSSSSGASFVSVPGSVGIANAGAGAGQVVPQAPQVPPAEVFPIFIHAVGGGGGGAAITMNGRYQAPTCTIL